MSSQNLVTLLTYLEPVLCVVVLTFLVRSKSAKSFHYLTAFLGVRLLSLLIGLPMLYIGLHTHDPVRHLAYQVYFYSYWTSYALEAILSLLLVYGIFKLAMAPLKGLQTLGTLVFRWVGAIAVAVAISVALNPHNSGIKFMTAMVTQLQQTSSILTLCMLLFVCFAIKPMGLSHQSRIFGVSLGLGIMAVTDLARAAWLSHSVRMYSTVNIVSGIAICLTLLTWSAYFAFPEPKPRIIVLPTTSPFLRWNQISMALGDEPGFVAVGGINPEIFAPAELEIMKRASAKMPMPISSEASSSLLSQLA
jgi:hypothetical protein